MPLIPLYLHSPLEDSAAARASAFNFCDPFDHVLPIPDGTISTLDRAHLWGLYSGIATVDPIEDSAAARISAFNFCDPFDTVLPLADGSVSKPDRAHLWGLYSAIGTPTGVLNAARLSAFNFCDPFDTVLPIADSTISNIDRAHLWGLYSGISFTQTISKRVTGPDGPDRISRQQKMITDLLLKEDQEMVEFFIDTLKHHF